ncbi:MAG: 3-oxoacyl-ACP reductase [Actinomycetota bacterium]|nr:3-oxoacyl-ACP reductase [Actinomycetota bacterium]
MPDRYQAMTGTAVGRFFVKNLGLPDPVRLRRYTEGEPVLSGPFLVGGSGGLLAGAIAAITATGALVHTERAEQVRYAGLVFDASGIETSGGLATLRDFFAPVLRSLALCPHVLVLADPPDASNPPTAGSTSARIAQRALEGFTRSLGKEIGRGGTVQLLYVDAGAAEATGSTVQFLLSPKSAYVSGQVVRVSTAADGVDEPGADPMKPLKGKVALVTGAAQGIGEAIARTLCRDGATVVGVDVPQAASALQTLMEALDGDAVTLDITAVDAPQRIARALKEHHLGVDIVVHNAGITRDKRLANMDDARWSSVVDVNLVAPERITTQLLDDGIIRPNGRIIGVASIAGIAGNAGQTNYATSKAGVIGFVDAVAPVAARQHVTVNAVAPGFIETRMTAAVPLMIREAGRRMNSMSQGGQPADVAETVAWLANPGSYGVTGNVVRVCGQSLLGA